MGLGPDAASLREPPGPPGAVFLGTAAGLGARWLVALPGLYGLYVVSAALFLRAEHRILRDQLQEEERFGVVPGWVVDVVPYYRRRVRAEWWPVRRERTIISRLLTRLAFRKHALRRRPPGEAEIAGLEVVQLRQQIKRIFEPEPDDHEA